VKKYFKNMSAFYHATLR